MNNHDNPSFFRRLPKIELHAHLNGSISPSAMLALAARKNNPLLTSEIQSILNLHADKTDFALDDFFPLFKCIYQLTEDEEDVTFAMRSVVEEFREDGVRYLELRTTPRGTGKLGMTKESYIKALVDVIQPHPVESPHPNDIIAKLILTLDRRHTLEECLDTVDLAIKYREQGVVGIDLAGDPKAGDYAVLRKAVLKAKAAGLKVTLHIAEIERVDAESLAMLEDGPDRLGHATFLNGFEREMALTKNIPIELCLTSNLICKTVSSYSDHHITEFCRVQHPIIICTDDKGIFGKTLSQEYEIAAGVMGYTRKEMFCLSRKGIEYVFAGEDVKVWLRGVWDRFEVEVEEGEVK